MHSGHLPTHLPYKEGGWELEHSRCLKPHYDCAQNMSDQLKQNCNKIQFVKTAKLQPTSCVLTPYADFITSCINTKQKKKKVCMFCEMLILHSTLSRWGFFFIHTSIDKVLMNKLKWCRLCSLVSHWVWFSVILDTSIICRKQKRKKKSFRSSGELEIIQFIFVHFFLFHGRKYSRGKHRIVEGILFPF